MEPHDEARKSEIQRLGARNRGNRRAAVGGSDLCSPYRQRTFKHQMNDVPGFFDLNGWKIKKVIRTNGIASLQVNCRLKSEIRFFQAGDKSPMYGGALERGKIRGSQTGEIRAGRGGCSLPKAKIPRLGRERLGGVGGSKQP
ncbi:hypothetical protein AVEN_11116-1 [Araneus ventricosus]|uniref:Uncharacterized protein n=1 Tax=Araneus ventricosus TaxID=182803 RepID=A0A4Y2L0L5_ARAVE|nr:hypothetical protein AVEN_11116-1 [Araneus ventricosus]